MRYFLLTASLAMATTSCGEEAEPENDQPFMQSKTDFERKVYQYTRADGSTVDLMADGYAERLCRDSFGMGETPDHEEFDNFSNHEGGAVWFTDIRVRDRYSNVLRFQGRCTVNTETSAVISKEFVTGYP